MAASPPLAAKTPPRARTGSHLSRERWVQILEVATRLFRAKGFSATSMQDVSDEVGLHKGSLYYYVRSKEELLFEVLRDLHANGLEIIESVRFGSEDPLAELHQYLRQLTIYAGQQRARLAIYGRDFRFIAPTQQKQIIAERDMYETVAFRLIEEAKARRHVDASIDSKVASHSILGSTAVTHEWYRPEGPIGLEHIAEQVAATIVSGLRHASVARGAKRAQRDQPTSDT
ncbi:MAG TPA: TetR/AcrR family transcriptional regulator [Terricaulis sp.]|nr:TetR/AcrR family transcriptional regulator [Terricaulis sp.]